MELPKVYDPKKVEDKIYRLWQKSGFFNPDKLPVRHKKPYVILMAPPNITGNIHLGHAFENAISDLLIRFHRMNGYQALFLPGKDHAGIAAQYVVEKELKKEGLTKFDLGREKFLKRVGQWMEEYSLNIDNQLKKLGLSCDWLRKRFTMDKVYQEAVKTAFLNYYRKGWIYRGKRVVNWCPRCQTSLSDLELEYKEEKGKLWYIKYPLKSEILNLKSITVATTRPETMLGDTAVAVNPKDERYQKLVGKKVILPLANREIPIIADPLVDLKFGTGAVKITPAHDLKDYEISLRHKLSLIPVINEVGKMTKEVPLPYQGLKIPETRQKVVEDLKKLGLLEKIEDYPISIPKCYRCGTTIEIIPSEQWFLKMAELAKMAIEAVKSGKIKFIPKRWEKIYFDWLKNIKDWCVSRQIWWGHKIPLKGQADVLDTWFSSALWPFAVFGWPLACASASAKASADKQNQKYCKPKKNSDLARFYPTDVISSAREIFYLWITRMVFSGLEFMGQIPFKCIYTHATILDKKGRKMSKSLGNVINPMDLIKKYGTDATRFGLVWQATGSQDIHFDEGAILMGKKFCNKIWNATRFVLMQINGGRVSGRLDFRNLTRADKKILRALNKTAGSVNKDLENFRFGQAAHKLYGFFWHDFCDKYVEISKSQISNLPEGVASRPYGAGKFQKETKKILLYVLLASLKLLHPFTPFITEEIYQRLPLKNKKKCLMIENWPL